MLLEQVKEDIQSSGLGAGNAFSIAASAKAFEVLSNSLYQNKVLAVIREITCNAVDAHRMVGKSVSDIQIHMPTYLAPYFAVRDFGPGLSHKEVLALYVTYFLSTKDASNDLIGGFGLGSKSPFAVADQFTVTVWQDGERRQYVCYKDGGVPAINHISSTPSDEPDGLEVRVAVPAGSLYRWEEEARNLFKWWPAVPKGVKAVDYALSDAYVTARATTKVGAYPEWAITGYTASPVVLMGGVPYALNFEAIAGLTPQVARMFAGLGLVLCFEVGQLNISPSREALSYDPTTCALLKQRLSEIVQRATTEVEAMAAKAPTLWEARRLVYGAGTAGGTASAADLLRRLGNKMPAIKWQGKPLTATVDFDLAKDFSAQATAHRTYKASHRKTWDKSLHAYDFRHCLSGTGTTEFWFWDDVITAKTYRKAQYAAEQEAPYYKDLHGQQRTPSRSVYVLTGVPFDEAQKFFEEKGLPPIRKVADLADPPKSVTAARKGPTTRGYTYSTQSGVWSRTESSIDLTQPGYWGKFFNGHCTDMDTYTLNNLRRLGVIVDGLPIVGFGKTRWDGKNFEARLEKLGWKCLTKDFIRQADLAKVQREAYAHGMQALAENSADFLKVLEKMKGLVKAPDFDPLVDTLVKDCQRRQWDRVYTWQFAENFSAEQKAASSKGHAEADAVKKKWQGWLAAHPLLKCALSAPGVSAQDIADYLNR